MKKLLLFIVVALVAAFLMRDALLKFGIEKGAELVTGLPVSIGELKTSVSQGTFQIRELQVKNPKGFEEPILLDMPEIFVQYDLGALLKNQIHLPELRVDLKRFNVVKDKTGRLNLDSILALQSVQGESKAKKEPAKSKAFQLVVDRLSLRVTQTAFMDFTQSPAKTQVFKLNLNEQYENIQNLNLVVSLIVAKALMNTTIAQLADFDVKGLNSSVQATWDASKEQLAAAAAKTKEALSGAPDTVKEKASEATSWLQKKADALKEKF